MVDPLDICKICLRTDVKLQEIDKELQNFHYAVTDFALFHVDSRLCPECEYLLRKWHNFNQKCVKAGKILQLWHRNMIMGKTNRKPLNTLFSQVPQSKLKVYAQTVTQTYTHEEIEPSLGHDNALEKQHDYNVKTEIEIEIPEVQIKDVTVKDEELQGIVIENVEKNDIELINEYDNENDDINDIGNDDTSVSSDDECLAAKKLRRVESTQSKVKKEKRRRITKTCSKEKVKKKFTKEDINFENGTELKTEENIINNLQNVDEDLNTVFVNWEKTSLKESPTVTYDKDRSTRRNVTKKKLVEKKGKKRRKDKKKDVVAKLKCLKADLENIWENCGKIVNYKEGLINPKERLRAELVSRFSSCGELKTDDGFVIDKEVVLGCFDRVSECLMKRLWRFMHGKATLESRAVNTLKHIQNKYQNEHTYESVFTIEYLNTKEKVAEEFEKRRSYECFLNAKYRCEQCFLGFKYEAQMENHRNMHEESAGEFACPTCGVRHKSKKSLDSHSKSHEAVYKCKLCPLVTYYRYSMMNHYNQHEGMEYRCQLCDTTFRSKSALKTHCGLRHSGKNATDTQSGGTVPCVPCGLSFPTRPAYLKHARSTHNSTTYIAHKAKEGAPKKRPVHTCRVCNAVGTSIGWLTLHFRMEHPTVDMSVLYADKHAHLCEICGKGYANIYNLRDHLAIHAGVRAHACAACGARFHRAISLAQHRLTHQPPRRACPSCGKRFHSQSNLNNHMRGHTGDRRYKCNLCGKGFLHRNALNEHVRGVHYKLRRVRKRDGEKLMRNDGN